MVKFKQVIRPGNKGRDVKAVKRCMERMNVPGNGSMGRTNFAGNAFIHCIRRVQRNHGIRGDGVYGKATHAIVAPHFNSYERLLYRRAKIRRHKPPGVSTTAQEAAKQLLKYYNEGKYRPDNPGDLPQIKAAAEGKAVWSPGGYYVHIDKRVFEALNFLIGKGYKIGTYAICSDHHWDGPHGHSGGAAVDISSINGVSVASQSTQSKENTLRVAKLLHSGMPKELHPWQLICDGYGGLHQGEISACTIPGYSFYGYPTMSGHRTHIHLGYY